ncbi:MAG: hypothetical protein ACO31Z_03790 [Litorivicinaceae bacterium]
MMFARFLVGFNLLLFVALALGTLINPEAVMASVGLSAVTGSGLIEFQVLISGTFFGLAALLAGGAFAGRSMARVLSGLLTLYVTWLIARLIALSSTSPDQRETLLFLIFEAAMIVLLLLASYLEKRSRQRSIFSRDL